MLYAPFHVAGIKISLQKLSFHEGLKKTVNFFQCFPSPSPVANRLRITLVPITLYVLNLIILVSLWYQIRVVWAIKIPPRALWRYKFSYISLFCKISQRSVDDEMSDFLRKVEYQWSHFLWYGKRKIRKVWKKDLALRKLSQKNSIFNSIFFVETYNNF